MAIKIVSPVEKLVVNGTGGTLLDVQGSAGQLFSVTDSLTGDLFAVSDISGIPILNVNSSGAVDIDGTLVVDGKLGVGLTPTTVNLEVKSIQDSSFDEGIGIVRSNTSQTGYINMVGGAMNINAPNAVPIKFRDGGNTNLTIGGDGNATFAGDVTHAGVVTIANTSVSQTSPSTQFLFDNNNIDDGGGYNIDFKSSSNDTANRFMARIQALRGSGAISSLGFFTETGSALTRALLLDSSQNATFTGTVTLPQHLKASGNNLSFSAGGNQILNIDLNGKVYPSTDNAVDLGFSTTGNRFRAGNFSGVLTASGGNSTNWNTAYGWGDHGLSAQDKTDIGNLSGTNTGDQTLPTLSSLGGLPLAGGTLTGTLTGTIGNFTGLGSFGEMITIDITDISTGENRGLKLLNSSGVDQQWNVTAGQTGVDNDKFTIRDATNNVDALTIAVNGGTTTLAGNLIVGGGDIVISGTGRIQGIDTVSANTDAANKTYVDTAIANLVDSSPAALNTLNELAAALGDDASFSTTVTNSIATKLPLAGGTLTGHLTLSNTNAPSNLAELNIGYSGGGETRAIDIQGNWTSNESKSITFTHGSVAANMVAQINVLYTGSSSKIRWGRFYHGGDSSTYTMELLSTSLTTANLTVSGNIAATNLSGTNTGDQTLPTLSSLGGATAAQGTLADNALPKAGGTLTGGLTGTTATFSGQAHFKDSGNSSGGSILMGPTGSGGNKWSYLAGTHYNQDTGSGNGSGSAGVAVIGCLSTSTYNKVLIGGNPYELNPATQIEFWTHTATTHTTGGSVKMKIAGDGAITFSTYGAGILKTNASGVVSLDTNTYSTASGVEDNADVTDATNVAAAGALMTAGGTLTGATTIQTTGGAMLILKDTNSVGDAANPYINFLDSAGTRQGYVGMGSGGNAKLYLEGLDGIQTNNPLTVSGSVTATGGNSTNWNTAYGWGDHGLSAQDKTDIGNLSGTNTGDQTLPTLSSLGALSASGTAFSLSGTDVTVGESITLAGGLSYSGTTLTSANDNTTYTASTGLTLTGTAFSVDYPVRVLNNVNYAPSDGTSSGNNSTNRANYGMGLSIYEGYNVGTDRPHTYDTTAQFMSTTSQGFELSIDWVSPSNTPLKIRSLRDCCQGWNPWTEVYTEASFSKASVLNSNVTLTSLGAAPLASPGLTGTPTAPTAGATANTTQLATTAFVQTAVSNLVDSSPGTLNTLNELAAALGDDASFSTTVTNSIATKLPLAGGTMTGSLILPYLSVNDTAGAANGTAEEVARFVNTTSGATSSYMYIGAAAGTDWRLGKNIIGTASNTNFGITKHSGTDIFLEIDGSGNTAIHGTIAASNLSGTNTGDQTLPTLSSLGGATAAQGTTADAALPKSGGTMTGHVLLQDSVELKLGTDTDLKIYHDGTNGRIANNTGHLYIQNLSDDKDIFFRSDDGSGGTATYLYIDGSLGKVSVAKPLVVTDNVTISGTLYTGDTITVGDGTNDSKIIIKNFNAVSEHIEFYNGSTRVGEIGVEDNTWLRINQETNKNIYTPRYIRADAGFFVDGTTKGINSSGNFIGGSITGASDANVSNWDTAYTYSQVGHLPLAGGTLTGDLIIESALLSNQENTNVDSAAAETVAQVAHATYTAAFFDFVIKKGTNVRAGTVYSCHDGTNVEFTETSTVDLGDTSDVSLSVDISGTNMRLRATVTSDDWIIKSLVRAI